MLQSLLNVLQIMSLPYKLRIDYFANIYYVIIKTMIHFITLLVLCPYLSHNQYLKTLKHLFNLYILLNKIKLFILRDV